MFLEFAVVYILLKIVHVVTNNFLSSSFYNNHCELHLTLLLLDHYRKALTEREPGHLFFLFMFFSSELH